MLHKKLEVVKSIVRKLEERFSKMSSVSCGLAYDFLGVKLSFADDERVCVDMREYLQKVIDYFREPEFEPDVAPVRKIFST